MRRADKEVKDLEQLEEILRACTAVRIGTRDERGMFIVPMSYGYTLEGEELTLFVHSAPEGRKVSAFRSGGEAAFEMDCGHALRPAATACGHSFTYRSIMGSGTIRELTGLEEKRTALNAIMVHMTGREWELLAEQVDRTAVFALRAAEWTGKRNQDG